MTATAPSPELLKRAVLELVRECKSHLDEGVMVDVSEIERGVRRYCEVVAAMPRDEGRTHTEDLKMLMQVVTDLSGQLVVARDAVRTELDALERIKHANTAYQKSDAIGDKFKKFGKKSS